MDAQNVSFGKPKAVGGVYIAPAGTTLPTDGTTALTGAYVNMGYISEDGYVQSIETDTEEIKAWGGDVVLTAQSSYKETHTVNFIETKCWQDYGQCKIHSTFRVYCRYRACSYWWPRKARCHSSCKDCRSLWRYYLL